MQTGPLTSEEAEWIDQLFASHSVFRIEPDPTNEYDPLVMAFVLITDSTCEVQNGDEKLNSGDPVDIRVSAFSACRLKAGARCRSQNDRPQIRRLYPGTA